MLIYNYKKEFLGIDELDLKALGFSSLAQLRDVSADFADLFVKKAGFVYNFKHVHWIDFITCAEDGEDSKVIIDVNEKNFICTLDVKTAFLVKDPLQKAYTVSLVGLREIDHEEYEHVVDNDQAEKPVAKKQVQKPVSEKPTFIKPAQKPASATSAKQDYKPDSDLIAIDDTYEVNAIDFSELPKTDDEHLEIEETEDIVVEEVEDKTDLLPDALIVSAVYQYDPLLVSKELGLPFELVEEFIENFIKQSQDLKTSLYDLLDSADIDNVKILSRELKDTAENLHIQDAFDRLSIVDISDDENEIKTNIDRFYTIVEKLSDSSESTKIPLEEEA
ncbi:MAG: hypothetical protein JJW00_09645 [Sulfurimonas sp.]|nr:hypothetical protein [Sulfurimonas sp.]